MITVASHVKIGGAVYQGVSTVIEAIDGLAAVLTGDKDYFLGPGTSATAGQRQAAEDKAERERGEKPWKR
jgi:hypothetical protein